MEKLIAVQELVFKNFLRYPDISVASNKVTFICGPSGCGKSTLFKMFNGTLNPSQGSVYYKGIDIGQLDKIQLRRKILLVKQVPYLFRGSIQENYQMFHQYHESNCPDTVEISEFLSVCCIDADIHKQCDEMSGGERQRVFLSIALSLMPEVLLLDEPTSALNNELSRQVMKQLIDYTKENKMNLLVISHDMKLQSVFADAVIALGEH